MPPVPASLADIRKAGVILVIGTDITNPIMAASFTTRPATARG